MVPVLLTVTFVDHQQVRWGYMVGAVACILVSIAYQLGLQPGHPGHGQRPVPGQLLVRHRLPGPGRPGLHRALHGHSGRPLHAGHAGRGHLRGHRGRPADAAGHRRLRAGPDRRHRLGPGPARWRVRRVDGRLRLDHRRRQLHLRPHGRLAHRADQLLAGPRLAQRVLRRGRASTRPVRPPTPSPRSSPRASPTWPASCRPSGWRYSTAPARSSATRWSPPGPTSPPTAATWPASRPWPRPSPTTPSNCDPRFCVLPVGYASDGELVMVIERSLRIDFRSGRPHRRGGRTAGRRVPAGHQPGQLRQRPPHREPHRSAHRTGQPAQPDGAHRDGDVPRPAGRDAR